MYARRFSGAVAMAGLAMAIVSVSAAPADAATRRCKQQSESVIRCWTANSVPTQKAELVEQVSFTNRRKKRFHASCAFEKSITRTVAAGVSLSVSAKASIFKVVEAEATVGVTASVEQSEQTATKLAADFWVSPGERVTCKRIYRYLRTEIKETSVSGSSVSTRTFSVNVPRLVDVVVT